MNTKLGKLRESFEAEQREVTNLKAREISELKSQLSKKDEEIRQQAHRMKLKEEDYEKLETQLQDSQVSLYSSS